MRCEVGNVNSESRVCSATATLLELKCSGDTFTGVQGCANNDSSYSAPISPLQWCHGNNNISVTGAYQVLPQQTIRC